MKRSTRLLAWLLMLTTAFSTVSCSSSSGSASAQAGAPNILFVIMDDVGIDQMASFGYGGDTPPSMPNITSVAQQGVRFRNTWSMPECSNGRASFFTGRYPFRTGIYQAIGGNDLANSQLTPYDVTVPKLLKNANYESAMFGKFHLAGPDNNQAGYNTPAELGWDYFYGWIGGLPGSLDSTAGGIAASGTYACGFVPSRASSPTLGADTGACYYANNTCAQKTQTSPAQDAAGLQCLDSGGIFMPNQSCGTPPSSLNFNEQNAYYVSPLLIIENGQPAVQVPLNDSRARGYRTRIEADAAINWINSKKDSAKPWMATVSFSAAHTPWQQAPKKLTPVSDRPGLDGLDCTNNTQGREIQNQMTEALDTEFGRIMVETGLAKRRADGRLDYDPKASNTMIVIVGDNGTFGAAVKLPFDANLAKGTAYQTGIWTPLIVAGPVVSGVDREVDHMVNMVDVFQFFGELAGLDVQKLVPRTIDSVGLLSYLTKPGQASLRNINFSMGGFNIQANGARNAPCVFTSSCSQVPISKSVCQDNGGVWWGSGYTDSSVITPTPTGGYTSCYQVNQAKYNNNQAQVTISPQTSTAIRNDNYKLIMNTTQTFDSSAPTAPGPNPVVSYELYQINQAAPLPKIDVPGGSNQIMPPYTGAALQAYNELYDKLQGPQGLLASQPYCPGDGNSDGVVDAQDLSNWQKIYNYATSSSIWSSVYNFMTNGVWGASAVETGSWTGTTSTTDQQVIQQNLGRTCPTTYSVH